MEYLKERGVRPAMVVDEGGARCRRRIPRRQAAIAVVGIGEKGFMNVELTARAAGGHASTPAVPSHAGHAVRARGRLRKTPVQGASDGAVRALFQTWGRMRLSACGWYLRICGCLGLCCRFWRAGWAASWAPMMRTTMAFTTAQGSKQINVLPTRGVGGRQPAACQSGYAGKCGAAPERRHPQR